MSVAKQRAVMRTARIEARMRLYGISYVEAAAMDLRPHIYDGEDGTPVRTGILACPEAFDTSKAKGETDGRA